VTGGVTGTGALDTRREGHISSSPEIRGQRTGDQEANLGRRRRARPNRP